MRLTALPPVEAPEVGPLESVTIATLEEAGRIRTVPGQIAVLLARRLDAYAGDTGSSVAAVAKQLTASVDAAVEDVKRDDDPLEMIRARMRARRIQSGHELPDSEGIG